MMNNILKSIKKYFRIVVMDAISKQILFDEQVENKKIETLKDKLNMKMLPYKKKVFIVDLALGYPKMLKDLFPNVKIQWCLFHLNQLISKEFNHYKKLSITGKKELSLQDLYHQYLLFDLFFNHEMECQFLKRQLKKLEKWNKMLQGCKCIEVINSKIISRYEMQLIFEFNEFRKGLKKHRRKYKRRYLLRWTKDEVLHKLKILKRDIGYFPKKIKSRIKHILKYFDRYTLFYENSEIPLINNNIEQYYSATLQKTKKKSFRSIKSLKFKLKIVREKWNKTLGTLKINFLSFLRQFAKLHLFFGPT